MELCYTAKHQLKRAKSSGLLNALEVHLVVFWQPGVLLPAGTW